MTSRLRVTVDGDAVELTSEALSVELVEPCVYSVLIDGHSYDVRLSADARQAWIRGRMIELLVEDPRELTAENALGLAAGRREITAPMPGKVVRVLVAEGEEVAAGQGIVVVEAMKMQNEMPSPKAGKVTSVRVRAGDAVAAGDVLAAVE